MDRNHLKKHSVTKNCSDLKNFANLWPSASNFKSFSRSLEQFFSHSRSEQFWQQNTIVQIHWLSKKKLYSWNPKSNLRWDLAWMFSMSKNAGPFCLNFLMAPGTILFIKRHKITPSFKGQLISKCLFGAFNFFQTTNENTLHSSKNEFIHLFFERIQGLTVCFRN